MSHATAPGGGPPLEPDVVEVLRMVARGWTDNRIARALGVSISTVKRRLNVAREALGSRSRVEVAVVATRLGVIDGNQNHVSQVDHPTREEVRKSRAKH